MDGIVFVAQLSWSYTLLQRLGLGSRAVLVCTTNIEGTTVLCPWLEFLLDWNARVTKAMVHTVIPNEPAQSGSQLGLKSNYDAPRKHICTQCASNNVAYESCV